MKKKMRILTFTVVSALLFSSMTVTAAPAVTASQNADYMMSINADGAPNWFSGTYYSDRYADLNTAFGTNETALYQHGLEYGFDEARLVTPVLNVALYRETYPDLDNAFGDNWELYIRHYFEYGISEGRLNFTDFNASTYLSMYEDLQNAFGTDLGLATRHYIEFGITEGRAYKWSEPVYEAPDGENDMHPENGTVTETQTDGSSIVTEYRDGKIVARTFYNANNIMTNHETYNEDEQLCIDSYYNENTGSLIKEVTLTYDADGNHIKSVDYDAEANYTITIEHMYDSNGNLLRSTQYNEDLLAYTTSFEYNNLGQKIKQVEINNLGEVRRTIVYTYYSDGTPESEISYYGETSSKENEIWHYESGVIKSNVCYDGDGNILGAIYYDEYGNEIQ